METIVYTFNKEKSLQVILYVLQNLQRRDLHKIFKILYFVDREFLAQYGMPITGDSYIAMDAGPVPSKIYDIFKIVRGDSYTADKENLSQYFSIEEWMYVKPEQQADMRKISPAEKRVIDEVIAKYGALSYDEIKEKSHDVAWRTTARDFPIAYESMALEAGVETDEMPYIASSATLLQSFSL